MTAEQTDLFDSNRELANRAAGKFPIAGEDEEFVRQEALIGLGKAVLAYDPAKGPFEPFAWQVIKNHLYSAYRSAKHRQIELLTLDENPDESQEADTKKDGIPDQEPTPAREAERSEIRVALQDGLSTLTPSQRAVLEQYAKGVSFAEVARETGASEQAVRQMFQRGANQIRPHLEFRGVATSHFLPGSGEPDGSRIFAPPFHTPSEKSPEKTNLPWKWVVYLWSFIAAILIWLAWSAGFFQ